MDDPNADLVGYEYDIRGEADGVTRWRVERTDPMLGAAYVQIRRLESAAMRVQNASTIRQRKQLEESRS